MFKNSYFYEIITLERDLGYQQAYYVYTIFPIQNLTNTSPIPDKVRLIIEDREERIIRINRLSFWKWIYLKYIHHNWIHPMYCFRVDWEKEEI